VEDRVAEILAQRAALESGTAAGVIFSLLMHSGLAAAAIYAALHAPAPKIASVLNIKFAPMPAPPAVVEPPKPVAPRIEQPKPEPIKPPETKKAPEKNTVPLSPFGKSKKKGSENPVPPPPVTRPPGNPGVTAQLEGGDFPYTIYIERMQTLIGSHWFRPQSANAVIIFFIIDRDGTIRDTKVETASGDGTSDRAALRAVLESSPLPPLPFGYAGTYLGVHLTFR